MRGPRNLQLTNEVEGQPRLDKLLADTFADISRARFQALIADAQVKVDGRTIVEPSFRVKPGSRICVSLPEVRDAELEPHPMALDILYEDDALLVINKPAGLVVHPGAGNRSETLVNALLAHCGDSLSGIGGVKRPGIVHRLDKDTSGILVVAKTDAAHKSLAGQFAAHGRDGRLERRYLALVWGAPPHRAGIIDANIARSPLNRTRMRVADDHGRTAVTRYKVLRNLPAGRTGKAVLASLVECCLETGRTHQIRVHMAHISHPVIGDRTYGASHGASARRLPQKAQEALRDLDRQALHAAALAFEHPVTGNRVSFNTPLPSDMQRLLDAISS